MFDFYSSIPLGRWMEGRMTTQYLDEYYVIQVDGLTKSGHHRFVDALRAALVLRDQFPEHDVKLRARQSAEAVH